MLCDYYSKFIGASEHEIWLFFLLECREDEEKRADFPDFSTHFRDDSQFYRWYRKFKVLSWTVNYELTESYSTCLYSK